MLKQTATMAISARLSKNLDWDKAGLFLFDSQAMGLIRVSKAHLYRRLATGIGSCYFPHVAFGVKLASS